MPKVKCIVCDGAGKVGDNKSIHDKTCSTCNGEGIAQTKTDFYYTSLQGNSLKELIAKFNDALAAQERGEWYNLELDIRNEYDYTSIVLSGERPETENERLKRENEEQRAKNWRRQQYENLKKEFGDT